VVFIRDWENAKERLKGVPAIFARLVRLAEAEQKTGLKHQRDSRFRHVGEVFPPLAGATTSWRAEAEARNVPRAA
jgi:hypothetical protein